MSGSPDAARPKLQSLLIGYHHRCLGEMCAQQAIDGKNLKKQERAASLAKQLVQARQVSGSVESLDEAARKALTVLQKVGGSAGAAGLYRSLVADKIATSLRRRANPSYYESAYFSGQTGGLSLYAQDILARLEVRGLVLGQGSTGHASVVDFGLAERYWIPREVWPHLPEVPGADPVPTPERSEQRIGDIEALTRQLYGTVSLWERQPPKLLKASGLLSKRDLKIFCTETGLPLDPAEIEDENSLPELRFQRELLLTLGLVEAQQDRSLAVQAAAARDFWRLPPSAQARRCHGFLQSANGWIELRHLRTTMGYSQYRSADEIASRQLLGARRAVEAALLQIGRNGDWYACSEIGSHLQLVDRDFLTLRRRYGSRYREGDWVFPGILDDVAGWRAVELEFIDRLLETFCTLGLIDLVEDASERPVAFRLNAMGRHIIGDAPEPAPAANAQVPLIIQPNARILALGPLPIETLAELEVFADRRNLDRAIELELTRDSVYRGQQAGLDAEAIAARLETLSGQALPQNVRRDLEEWQAGHERITIRRGLVLIHSDRADRLDRLFEADTQGWLRRLSERVAEVDPSADLDALSRATGLSISEASQGSPLHRVELAESGRVHAPRGLPSLPDLGRLQVLAEGSPEEGWQLGRSSVQRAIREEGLKAPGQIEAWRSLLGDATPDWLDTGIKTWGGHFGRARDLDPHIIELPSEESLAALREDPRWPSTARKYRARGPLLQLENRADLEAFKALLLDFGIEIDGPREADQDG